MSALIALSALMLLRLLASELERRVRSARGREAAAETVAVEEVQDVE